MHGCMCACMDVIEGGVPMEDVVFMEDHEALQQLTDPVLCFPLTHLLS